MHSALRGLFALIPLAAFRCAAQVPAPARPETVVVTGTYEPLSLDEVDRAITVLPARDSLLVLGGLTDLLESDPSLDVRQRAPGGVQADLSIRGSGYGQTLVLLNGQRLKDAQSGHHDMDIPIPLEAVTRVEVLRGSGSTVYGSDAVAGVVNIVTAPPQKSEVRLRTALGSFGTNQQHVSLSGSRAAISEQLVFARDFSSGFRPDRDYRNLQIASTTHVSSGVGPGDLTLAYMDRPFGADQFYGNFNSWEDTKTWIAGGQQALGAKTTASFAFRRHSDLFVLYRDRPEVFTNRHAVESEQVALRRRDRAGNTISFAYGAEALHESIDSSNLGGHQRTRGAVYGAIDGRTLRRFSLSLAAREEVYRRFSGAFSPTASGGVWLSARWKLRASASRAFRIPSYTELYYHDPGNQGNPHLRPERAWTYEAGCDWNAGGQVHAEVTVFTRREREGIDYYRRASSEIWRAVNVQNLNFTGIETGLHLAPARAQSIDLRYTALRGAREGLPQGETKYTFAYPRHSGTAEWRAALGRDLLVRTRVGAVDRRGQSPYALWDVHGGYTRGHVHPFLNLSNINSARYQDIPGVVMPGRSILGGLEFVWPAR